jgi:MoaA/NifB/PqqE/SkfB family radical SAM enzyme
MSTIFDPQSKVLANFDYVRKLLTDGITAPVLVEIDPSNTCNHACTFCISSYIHLPESKDLDTYNKDILPGSILNLLVQDLADMKVKALNWTGGGEPTVNPALPHAIEHAGIMDIKQGMFTNAS